MRKEGIISKTAEYLEEDPELVDFVMKDFFATIKREYLDKPDQARVGLVLPFGKFLINKYRIIRMLEKPYISDSAKEYMRETLEKHELWEMKYKGKL